MAQRQEVESFFLFYVPGELKQLPKGGRNKLKHGHIKRKETIIAPPDMWNCDYDVYFEHEH